MLCTSRTEGGAGAGGGWCMYGSPTLAPTAAAAAAGILRPFSLFECDVTHLPDSPTRLPPRRDRPVLASVQLSRPLTLFFLKKVIYQPPR